MIRQGKINPTKMKKMKSYLGNIFGRIEVHVMNDSLPVSQNYDCSFVFNSLKMHDPASLQQDMQNKNCR